MGAAICGVFTKVEMLTHFDMQSVGNQRFGLGTDIDSAVLAATSFESARQQKVIVCFECTNLPNIETFSKSDTVIYLYKKACDLWIMVGQTEVIHDNLNPKFV